MLFKVEKIRKELEKRLDYHESLLEAWEKVKRQYTKAGKDFKIASKNFSGCSFYDQYGLGTEITVITATEKNGHITEGIRVVEHIQPDRNGKLFYGYNDYSKPLEEYGANTKLELDKEKEKIYDMNYYFVWEMKADFIEYLINNNKLRHKLKIAELKKQLETLDDTCNRINELLLPAVEEVNKQGTDFRSSFMETFDKLVFWRN